jgi:hypothetical protein
MGSFIQSGSFTDIIVGDLVIVKGPSTVNNARHIVIIKFSANIEYIQGSISSVTSDAVVIAPNQGSAVTLGWDSNSRFLLNGIISVQAGQRIFAVYDNNTKLFKLAMVKTTATPTPSVSATPSVFPTATIAPSGTP